MANPRYKFCSRKYFSTKAIPEKYRVIWEVILKKLANASCYHISINMRRSENQNSVYMVLAAHSWVSALLTPVGELQVSEDIRSDQGEHSRNHQTVAL
jgi:hypothetical protein